MKQREAELGPRLSAALESLLGGDPRPLLDAWGHATGLPGPRANLTLARTIALELAAAGSRGRRGIMTLIQSGDEYATTVAAVALGELAARQPAAGTDLEDLGTVTHDDRRAVSQGVVAALAQVLGRLGPDGATLVVGWTTDLHRASLALAALADRDVLAAVRDGVRVVELLERAWALRRGASRAADRSPGLRRFRRELPDQVALCASRFPEVRDWLVACADVDKPEDREVLERTLVSLRRAGVAEEDVERLAAALARSAPPPRDPTRIRGGTRRRGRRGR